MTSLGSRRNRANRRTSQRRWKDPVGRYGANSAEDTNTSIDVHRDVVGVSDGVHVRQKLVGSEEERRDGWATGVCGEVVR